jgi:hypothetical protein
MPITTTATDAYNAFLANQALPEYAWPATAELQDAEMRDYTALKVAMLKEQAANQAIYQAEGEANADAEATAIHDEMVAKGYSGDGTLADFIKLYTRPDINSSNSEALATSYFNANEDFTNHYRIHRVEA